MPVRISHAVTGAAAAAALLVTLTAGASTPPPNEEVAVAKASVQRAEQAGAPEFAPVELAAAREKLVRADKADAEHQAIIATQLAEAANADAQLAEARAIQQKSHKAALEFDASMVALRQESNRSTPPAQ
jgi:hypothetical protein